MDGVPSDDIDGIPLSTERGDDDLDGMPLDDDVDGLPCMLILLKMLLIAVVVILRFVCAGVYDVYC